MRLETTPLAATVPWPQRRPGGVDPRVLEAAVVSPCTVESRQRLLAPGTIVITTGQQPGLFTGPLFTVYKALSAVALARHLESVWHAPVVPVFWLATDDHDFAEASTAAWPAQDGSIRRVSLRVRAPDAPLTPMYREPLGPEIEEALAALARDLPADGFAAETMAWLRRHYRPGETVGGAYARALAEMLCPYGVVCLDAGSVALKRLAAPYLMQALEQSAPINARLVPLAAELEALGQDPEIAVGDPATLVMLEGAQGRDRLLRDGEQFHTRRSGERFTLAELSAIAAAAPERLSPNVLLRPVVESALLPTAAYVAGPGELRYLALAGPVYGALGVHRQQPLPRWSGVAIEPRVERVMTKFDLNLDDLAALPGALEARLARSQLPDEVVVTLAHLRKALEQDYTGLAQSAAGIDPTLEKTVLGARGNALHGVGEIEKKLLQHMKRRVETELGQINRARALVRPEGKPQERCFTVAPYLGRYGPRFLDDVLSAASAWYAAALEAAAARS
jgi:bacillithiol biosynthesis cysteine-adding enzyme BshC